MNAGDRTDTTRRKSTVNVNNFSGDYGTRRLALEAAVKASVLAFLTVRHLHMLADSHELYADLLEERRVAAAAVLCHTRCEYFTAAQILEDLKAESPDPEAYVRKVLDATARLQPHEAEALLACADFDDRALEAARLRSFAAFRALASAAETERRDAADSVICRFRGRLLTARGVSDLLASEATGNSCIPETFEYDWACRVLEAAGVLDEDEALALSISSGVTPDSLGEIYAARCEAVSDAYNELYGEGQADEYRDGHRVWCDHAPRACGTLTLTCTRCDGFWDEEKVAGPAEDVRAYVADFRLRYDNPGYWGRASEETALADGLIEVTVGRRAVCD
jgi:hypothetical protein